MQIIKIKIINVTFAGATSVFCYFVPSLTFHLHTWPDVSMRCAHPHHTFLKINHGEIAHALFLCFSGLHVWPRMRSDCQ